MLHTFLRRGLSCRTGRGRLVFIGLLVAITISGTLQNAALADTPIRVEVAKTADGWQLLRGGKPYFIKGVGGDAPKPLLAQLGGNCFRTWGADHIASDLDQAQKLGLTVIAGMWLGHKRAGFDYHNP